MWDLKATILQDYGCYPPFFRPSRCQALSLCGSWALPITSSRTKVWRSS